MSWAPASDTLSFKIAKSRKDCITHSLTFNCSVNLHTHWVRFPNFFRRISESFQRPFFKNLPKDFASLPLSVLVCVYWPPSSLLACSGGKSVSNLSAVTVTDRAWFKGCQSCSQTVRPATAVQTDLCLPQSVINVSLFLPPSSENTHSRSFVYACW